MVGKEVQTGGLRKRMAIHLKKKKKTGQKQQKTLF